MKKKLMIATILGAMSVYGTAMAAAPTTFNDVPKEHWAYQAVTELAKAGIVEGFADKSYQGDKTMTRYEMAQVVEKAMTNTSKATAAQKALVDKLAVEFALEMNKIDTRVKKLEKANKSTLRVGFDFLATAGVDNPASGKPKVEGNEAYMWRPRLLLGGDLNDQTSFFMRVGTQLGNPGMKSTSTAQGNSIWMDQAYLNFNDVLGVDAIRLGRHGINELGGLVAYKSGSLDGITVTKKLSPITTLKVGSLVLKPGLDVADNGATNAQDVQYAGMKMALDKTLTVGAMYMNNSTETKYTKGSQLGGVSVAKKMGEWTLLGEYDQVDYKDETTAYAAINNPKAYGVQISNGKNTKNTFVLCPAYVTDIKKPGDSAFSVAYRYLDPDAIPSGMGPWNNATINSSENKLTYTDNSRGWIIDYQYVIQKNVNLTFDYQSLKYAKSVNGAKAGEKMNDMFSVSLYTIF